MGDHDLVELCRETVELHRPTTENHRWVLDLPTEPVVIRCDATRIVQVLNNLISNALKYSPEGGLVRVALADAEDTAIVSVSDQGIGISPAERDTIFEPFRRSSTTRDTIPGVGLGLSVARRILEAHGGTIEVRSEEGRGSTFRFFLPHAQTTQPGTPSENESEERPAVGEGGPALH